MAAVAVDTDVGKGGINYHPATGFNMRERRINDFVMMVAVMMAIGAVFVVVIIVVVVPPAVDFHDRGAVCVLSRMQSANVERVCWSS